jgi:chemotaxis protein methyltransferase CheR
MTHDDPTRAEGRRTLEQAIVDTVREPLIVLDAHLHVLVASRSFYSTFGVSPIDVEGRALSALGDGQWDKPELARLLGDVLDHDNTIENYEIELESPVLGHRVMLLNARKVFAQGNVSTNLLVAVEDVTERRVLEREKDELLLQKELLLQEMNHRVNNSLQIIASIILLKARTVQSEDTRRHLKEAHDRVLAVATVQEQLQPAAFGARIGVQSYLTRLCDSLAASMIPEDQPVTIKVEADDGDVTSEEAVSMGLIATELVINALKYAFPNNAKGNVIVRYESSATLWRLAVSDDGVGISTKMTEPPVRSGLGTSIVEALTRQLGGRVTLSAESPGTMVTIAVPKTA